MQATVAGSLGDQLALQLLDLGGQQLPFQLDLNGLVAQEVHRLLGDLASTGLRQQDGLPLIMLRPSRISFAFTSGCTLPAMRVPVMAL